MAETNGNGRPPLPATPPTEGVQRPAKNEKSLESSRGHRHANEHHSSILYTTLQRKRKELNK